MLVISRKVGEFVIVRDRKTGDVVCEICVSKLGRANAGIGIIADKERYQIDRSGYQGNAVSAVRQA